MIQLGCSSIFCEVFWLFWWFLWVFDKKEICEININSWTLLNWVRHHPSALAWLADGLAKIKLTNYWTKIVFRPFCKIFLTMTGQLKSRLRFVLWIKMWFSIYTILYSIKVSVLPWHFGCRFLCETLTVWVGFVQWNVPHETSCVLPFKLQY